MKLYKRTSTLRVDMQLSDPFPAASSAAVAAAAAGLAGAPAAQPLVVDWWSSGRSAGAASASTSARSSMDGGASVASSSGASVIASAAATPRSGGGGSCSFDEASGSASVSEGECLVLPGAVASVALSSSLQLHTSMSETDLLLYGLRATTRAQQVIRRLSQPAAAAAGATVQ